MNISSTELIELFEKRAAVYETKPANTTDSKVVRLLEHLQTEELDQARKVTQLMTKFIDSGSWPKTFKDQRDSFSVQAKMKEMSKSGVCMTPDDTEMTVLQKAIALKTDSVVFYHLLADSSMTPEEFHMFSYISKIETDHMVSMKTSLEYLEDPCASVYPL